MEAGENLLRDKRSLEGTIANGNCDARTLQSYVQLLYQIDRHYTGVLDFRWADVPYPLYFRCGSTDLGNFAQIFLHNEYDFPLPFKPENILDLGAYVGFAAIFLARRFPDAEIVCVEPSADNFRLLTLNTSAWSNIRRINAAVWSESAMLRFAQYTPGDWGTHMVDTPAGGPEIAALSLPEIIRHAHWDKVDLLKCDIEGAELKVFPEAQETISRMVNCCAIELHEHAAPGSTAAVSACFDSADFDQSRSGEYHVYTRRLVEHTASRTPVAHLLRAAAGPREIVLNNVPPEGWGYYIFDGVSCQLNAPDRTLPCAELSTEISLSGQHVFDCEVMVENPLGHGVTFGLSIRNAADDSPIVDTSIDVAAGERKRWTVPSDRPLGACRVTLRTRMSPGSPTNHQVRSYWLAPRFHGELG